MNFQKHIIRKFWLYESIFSELMHASSPKKALQYCDSFLQVLQREHKAIISLLKKEKINKVVSVGSGVIPFSCLFYSDIFSSSTIGLDSNYIAVTLSRFICNAYFRKSIPIVYCNALQYGNWNNALVIVSLLTQGKAEIVSNILRFRNNIIIIRNPLHHIRLRYEYSNNNSFQSSLVKHPHSCFDSLVLNNADT